MTPPPAIFGRPVSRLRAFALWALLSAPACGSLDAQGVAAASAPALPPPAPTGLVFQGGAAALPEGSGAIAKALHEDTPAIRGPLGDLPLFTLDGAPTTLAAVGAKVTVIAMWGSACVPCINELPSVDALYNATRGERDVAVLTLVVDDARDPAKKQAVVDIVTRLKLSVPVLYDYNIGVYRRLNGEDALGGKLHKEIVIPQIATVDPAFNVHLTVGYRAGSTGDFVAAQRALIDLARQGRLPPNEPLPTPTPSPYTAFIARPGRFL